MMVAASKTPPDEEAYGRRLVPFLLLSLLAHALAGRGLLHLSRTEHRLSRERPPLRVRRLTRTEPRRHQIVDAPPVPPRASPPPDAFAGRRDQRVPHETIVPRLGPAENALRSEARERTRPKGLELARLLPDPYATGAARTSRQPNAIDRPLGEVTLLNTRSHPWADYLIDRGWRAYRLLMLNAEGTTWYATDLRRLRLPARVRVRVAHDGRLLERRIERSSGSAKVDHLLLGALAGALRGRIPPPKALGDAPYVDVLLELREDRLAIGVP